MKMTELTATQGNNQFYPTPPSVAGRMLAGIDFRYISSILEPSAGKGNLINALARAFYDHGGRNNRRELDVDCCEIDPHLRQILKYEFSEQKVHDLWGTVREIDKLPHSSRTEAQSKKLERVGREIGIIENTCVHVVHDDFLSYRAYKPYQLILMNPPFADGDRHLLKAIELQREGGAIVCLLNAETLRNPYSLSRKMLAKTLNELGAKVEYIEDAFSSDAERKASVDVAIVRINIPYKTPESTIYERMKASAEHQQQDIPDPDIEALVPGNYLEQAVQMYRVEVDATMELIREYKALVPYMSKAIDPDDRYAAPILTLVVDHDSPYSGLDIGKYMKMVRLKYWTALFHNPEFTGRLTSALVDRYRSEVERMADYDFSMFNIKQVLLDMSEALKSGVENAIMELFDKLTVDHTWYPECAQNIHYYNGWRTNKAHKIGKKCIIPTHGMFSSNSWDKTTFSESTAYKVISDIEKALNYLNAQPEDGGYDLRARLAWANSCGQTRNISLKYFRIDLFKKGTCHIKFHPETMPIIDRLNIYAAQKKAWLPPNYGKSTYADMDAEERAVVDSFNGNGDEGSGEAVYFEIMRKAAFYLAEPTQRLPALMAAATEGA